MSEQTEMSGGSVSTKRGRFGWMMFDFAAQPYFTLVTTFIFAPYFIGGFVTDPVQGQVYWSMILSIAGIMLACLSPVLGAIADRTGPRKPWIAVFSVIYIIGMSLLWYAKPGEMDYLILVMVGVIMGNVAVEFATVFNNSMINDVAKPGKAGQLSGFGWALGYVGGLLSLILVLGFLSEVGDSGKTMLGYSSILGFDSEMKEADRFSGPLSAIWYAIFAIPMFLFTKEAFKGNANKEPYGAAIKNGIKDLVAVFINMRQHSNLFKYFLARMVYYDGITALFAYGGIYAKLVFDWDITTLGIFGIILSVAAAIGAFVGGLMDDWLGPKRVIIISLIGLIVASLGILSVNNETALLFIELPALDPNRGLFGSLGEQIILVFGIMIGIFSGPAQAASRTMLLRITPENESGKYFGLFALSGKATAFLAPAMIAYLTLAFNDERMSLVTILGFLIVGIVLMLIVKQKREGEA